MKTNIKISIVTVTYNAGAFLEDCIKSVIEQDYPNIEYIIVDGKSTDGSLSIIQSFKSGISKWISEPDNGIYDAINKGIKLATGDIVGILNADDVFARKDVVSGIVQSFVEDIEIVYADVDFVLACDIKNITRHYSSKFFKPWMFRFGFQPAHPTFYTYRKNFDLYGYYRKEMRIAGDFELLLRFIYKHKLPYHYLNETLVKMRLGGVSTSGIKSVIKLNKEIMQSFKMNKLYTNIFMVYSKYFVKWWGFVFKT